MLADFCIVRYPWCSYNFCVYGSARRKSKPAAGIFLRCILATCGVLLSIILKTKDAKLKEVALPSFISAIFGVTEPGTYGVTLPRKKMFAICCIGGAASGVVVALSNLAMYSYAGMGIIGLLGFINPDGPNLSESHYLRSFRLWYLLFLVCWFTKIPIMNI